MTSGPGSLLCFYKNVMVWFKMGRVEKKMGQMKCLNLDVFFALRFGHFDHEVSSIVSHLGV